jgi:methyltransferase (TIGR00027 family)
VLLAAGYDSRAWRLPALADGARIFEVDHPATQRRKLALLRRRRADAGRATFVAIDLLNQSVAERLLASGFDRDQPTVFVAEGVTMYLTPSAVGKLLALPAALAPAGSRLVFDYLEAGALAPGQELAEVRRMRRWRWLLGEEMSCGLAPDGLPALLQQHGLALVEAVSAAELAARFGCVLATGYGLVTARVAPVG